MSDIAVLKLEGGKANAMTPELLDSIEKLVDDFEHGPARAAVLTGYDKYFCAGLPLPNIIGFDRPAMRDFIDRFSRTMLRVYSCAKPIVAAINGHAIAGGCVLALMCDFRVMYENENYRIGLNETRLGIGLPAIVVEPLRALVSPPSLTQIAVGGALYKPREAQSMGLVNALVLDGDIIEAATSWAHPLTYGGDGAVRQVKRALRRPIIDAIARTHAIETETWLDTWFSEDGQRLLHAQLAKMQR